jgi:hypothetical protein
MSLLIKIHCILLIFFRKFYLLPELFCIKVNFNNFLNFHILIIKNFIVFESFSPINFDIFFHQFNLKLRDGLALPQAKIAPVKLTLDLKAVR